MRSELVLDEQLGARPDLRYEDLSGFRVEVAAIALEMRTEQHDVAAQVLLDQVRIRRRGREAGGALEVNLPQARHPIVLPPEQ